MLAEKLKVLMIEHNVSREQLCDIIHVSMKTLQSILQNKRNLKNPELQSLVRYFKIEENVLIHGILKLEIPNDVVLVDSKVDLLTKRLEQCHKQIAMLENYIALLEAENKRIKAAS